MYDACWDSSWSYGLQMVAVAVWLDARMSSRFAIKNALLCSYSCFSTTFGSRSVRLTTVSPVDDPRWRPLWILEPALSR